MTESIPIDLLNDDNRQVLNHLSGQGCHGDIVEPLEKYLADYKNVKSFCPNPEHFSYCFWYFDNKIFALGTGMQRIKLKLLEVKGLKLVFMELIEEKSIGPTWYSIPWNSPHLKSLVRDSLNTIRKSS